MTKASTKETVAKQPKTIKVKTLVLSIMVIALAVAALIGAFYEGYQTREKLDNNIRYEAVRMVSQLKANQ